MPKFEPIQLTSFTPSMIANINTNFQVIRDLLDDTISRSGQEPNQMEHDLDLNHYDILNVCKLEVKDFVYNGVSLSEYLKELRELLDDIDSEWIKYAGNRVWYYDEFKLPPDNGGSQTPVVPLLPDPYIETGRALSGGWGDQGESPRLPGQKVGKVVFSPMTEGEGFYQAPVSTGAFTGRPLIMSSIRTVFLDQYLGRSLFEPVTMNEAGVSSFRYTGKLPIHGVLQGSVKLARRVNQIGTAGVEMLLGLRDLTPSENEGAARKVLGLFPALEPGAPLWQTDSFSDVPSAPTQATMLELISEPNLYPGSVAGWIGVGQSYTTEGDDGLLPIGYPGSTVGQDLRTTNWFPVEPGEAYTVWPDGNASLRATRMRVQLRGADGRIWYLSRRSMIGKLPMTLIIPKFGHSDFIGATPWECRIYWHYEGDTVESITIKKMTAGQYTTPWGGNWVVNDIHTARDVVFYPGHEYRFDVTTTPYNSPEGSVGFPPEGLRCYSGGFVLDFDATDLYAELLTTSRLTECQVCGD